MSKDYSSDPRARQTVAANRVPVDLAANIPSLANYWFLAVTTTVTVSGYFVDIAGNRVGNSFSSTVPTGNGTNDPKDFATLYGSAIPSTAVGFVGQQSGDLYVDIVAGGASADFKSNYARFPKLGSAYNQAIGRVNV